ncbi:CPXCG motif-containing cysteine-rich protein [Thiohalophilus sp.]|uniref:CPXCG motif-containing cysteine-rich protein n=1 Tax=Thiohalophilus sp. TaxID=3028392 RepID=UPI002ACE31A3|nr:CPXCG motif-containing cysteine-rich protein [Thiohalophilus sp.]MDZ7803658.1 CPXCG motif-containing cysteine-rich protein [Thiohalophilus sp.]
MLDEVDIACPYCGEVFTTVVDYSAGDQDYIEDCYVCCRPIHFSVMVDINGELTEVITRQDNE